VKTHHQKVAARRSKYAERSKHKFVHQFQVMLVPSLEYDEPNAVNEIERVGSKDVSQSLHTS